MLKELLLNPDLTWMQDSSNTKRYQHCIPKKKVSKISQKKCQCFQKRSLNGKTETNKSTIKRQSSGKAFKVKNKLCCKNLLFNHSQR